MSRDGKNVRQACLLILNPFKIKYFVLSFLLCLSVFSHYRLFAAPSSISPISSTIPEFLFSDQMLKWLLYFLRPRDSQEVAETSFKESFIYFGTRSQQTLAIMILHFVSVFWCFLLYLLPVVSRAISEDFFSILISTSVVLNIFFFCIGPTFFGLKTPVNPFF